MLAPRCVFYYDNRHNWLIFGPLGCPHTPKLRVSTHVNGLSWRLINPDHGTTAFIHVYILSGCNFYYGNRHNWLIFDPLGCPDTPKLRVSTHVNGLSWPLVNPDHGTTAFVYVYIQCRDCVSLSLCFLQWQQAQLTDIWPSRVPRHPKIEGGCTC